jgi:hypothetical protein
VNAHTGAVREDYCSNVIGPIKLLDDLIALGLGDTALYRAARTTAWNWMMNFPMQNNYWSQYFEDVPIQTVYNNNLNQYNSLMTARYLVQHPEYDANWEAHVRGLITWSENLFGQQSFGATTIKEQIPVFPYVMGSHASRYASVNALLYERTGDTVAKEKAYRSFNWATYMARSNGVVIDGPDVNTQWFTDGYGDYVRHFMTGLAAVPEWSPANQTHLLRSSSVIQSISYGSNNVNYTTYDATGVEVLHVGLNPISVSANGLALFQRADLNQPGWTLDIATKTLRIYRVNASQISISLDPVSVKPLCPADNISFTMQVPINDYDFQWQIDSTGSGFVDLANDMVHSGVHTNTLTLHAPPTSFCGYKYRCVASENDIVITGTVNVLKFIVTWKGDAGTAWNSAANWSCNYIPDGFTDVLVPGGTVYSPVISKDAAVHSLITYPGAVLTINPGIRLEIRGK